MGITVDLGQAEKVLEAAAKDAASDAPVPDKWLRTTRRIDECPSTSFTPVLGTALLARATNPSIDALALKAKGARGYSARALATEVLAPGAVTYGYHLRTTGREPLNNQPFFRYDRIDDIEGHHVRRSAQPYLPDLIAACRSINKLTQRKAQEALTAFLRVRMEAADERQAIDLRGTALSMVDLLEQTESFVEAEPEGGRRGQAFVAAAFDLGATEVRSQRVNDPSRHFPGDVQVLAQGTPVLAIEVRQKVVTPEDVSLFAAALRDGKVASGLVAMLHPDQPKLDVIECLKDAERDSGVFLWLAYGTLEILATAGVWCGQSLADVLLAFPLRMAERLEEIEVKPGALRDWEARFPEADE